VEFDRVDAHAVGVMRLQRRHVLVGNPPEFEGFGRSPGLAMRDQLIIDRLRNPFHERAQCRIGREKVHADERRRLVEDVVGVGAGTQQVSLASERRTAIRCGLP